MFIKLVRYTMIVLFLALLALVTGEAAADGNPAALVVVAVVFGVFAGVVVGLFLATKRPTNVTNQHLHVYPAQAQPGGTVRQIEAHGKEVIPRDLQPVNAAVPATSRGC